MPFQLLLPDIGEGVVEAEVQRWHVKPGDRVAEDQPLVEVMTDKATVTIPSPRSGTVLALHFAEGAMARVHDALVSLELDEPAPSPPAEGGAAPAAGGAPPGGAAGGGRAPEGVAPPAAAAGGGVQPAAAPAGAPEDERKGPGARALATPAVRALARQLGVDLAAVRGSGEGGRVTHGDVEVARAAAATAAGAAAGRAAAPPLATPVPLRPRPAPAPAASGDDEVLPLRGIRRRMAERMTLSKRTAAHFTFVEQVDATELVRLRERVAAAASSRGVKVTYLAFVVKAVTSALRRHPLLNATLDEARGEIRLRRACHVGIATATPAGLLVPVVRDASQRSILDLAREIERLAGEAKAGRARPEDMGGSTFTVTSLGAQGGLFATPIINHPEVAILGVHRIRPTPVVRDGQIVAREVMHLALSFDHRVVDGQVGAAFAYDVIAYLEDPSLLFVELV